MKSLFQSPSAIVAATLATFGLATGLHAQVLTISPSAPTGNVIASNTTGDETVSNVTHLYIPSNYVAGDNGSGANLHMLGQSFTTGTLGSNNVLSTISVQSTAAGWRNYGGTLTLNLFEVTDTGSPAYDGYLGAGTLLQSWTASSDQPAGNVLGGGEWITFDLSSSNLTLQDDKVYAFTISGTGTGGDNSKIFFEWNGTSTNAYSGGQAMSQDVADQPGGLWFGSGAETTGDRVFQVATIPQTVSDYNAWAGASGYNLAEGPDGDDDKDGMTNREEYAFGLVPNNGSSCNPIVSQLNKTSGQFTYTRRDPVTKNTGLTYTIWTSTNLTDWNLESDSSAVQTPGTPDGNGIQSVAVTLTPIPTAPVLFIQVRAN